MVLTEMKCQVGKLLGSPWIFFIKAEIKWTFGYGSNVTLDRSPGACYNGHIWQLAHNHPMHTPNHRKNVLKKYHPFWCSFCGEHTWITLPVTRMAGAVNQACSQPCNRVAILWMAATSCKVIGSCGTSLIVLFWCALGRTTLRAVLPRPCDLSLRDISQL